MRLSVLGRGCVSSLGREWAGVRAALSNGVKPELRSLPDASDPARAGAYPAMTPQAPSGSAGRLRRSSSISYFACAAAAEALGGLSSEATALVFASSNGAVSYTRKFFAEVMDGKPGSPLLFPETVYNAAPSHVAAMLGIDSSVLALVGDASAGLDALAMARTLLGSGSANQCLVVAAEELDWIACEGYARWGLTLRGTSGAVLSEGGTALLVGPSADGAGILRIHPGRTVPKSEPAAGAFRAVIEEVTEGVVPDLAVVSCSGGRVGRLEEAVIRGLFPEIRVLAPKRNTGEAFAASSLLQCALAVDEVERGTSRAALVSVFGWNRQVGAAVVAGGRK